MRTFIFASLLLISKSVYSNEIKMQIYVDSTELATSESVKSVTNDKIELLLRDTNAVFRNSGVNFDIEYDNVKYYKFNNQVKDMTWDQVCDNCDGKAISQHMLDSTGPFKDLATDADKFGYDYTLLLVNNYNACASAAKISTISTVSENYKNIMIANINCGGSTVAHELGHLMGLRHSDWLNKVENGVECSPYYKDYFTPIDKAGQGYTNADCNGRHDYGEFATIMLSNYLNNGKSNIPLFSNPRMNSPLCGYGKACGVPNNNDSVYVLNKYADLYAKIETVDVDGLNIDSKVQSCLKETGIKEANDVIEVVCDNMGITNTYGLSSFPNVKRISLKNNPFFRFSSANLTNVEQIDLSGSTNIFCSDLKLLENSSNVILPSTCRGEAIITSVINANLLLN